MRENERHFAEEVSSQSSPTPLCSSSGKLGSSLNISAYNHVLSDLVDIQQISNSSRSMRQTAQPTATQATLGAIEQGFACVAE